MKSHVSCLYRTHLAGELPAPYFIENIDSGRSNFFHYQFTLLFILLVAPSIMETASAATFFGPTPYLSSADIPTDFYAGGAPIALEDFEDQSLDFGISVSGGGTSPPALPTRTDSVDADDGVIDGSGSGGTSWFIDDLGGFAELTFTFSSSLPTAAGIVWTDGAQSHDIFFEAFGPGMTSLGVIGPFNFADAFNTGQTGEDRFFGVQDLGGILAIRIRNANAPGGIEVDHVQFGAAVPIPASLWLFGSGLLGLIGLTRRRKAA
jgi:hypothetical protein